MATRLEIKNMALQLLGEEPIASSGEETKASVMMETFYSQSLAEILAEQDWNFAHKRAAIAYDIEAPAFEFSYQYLLPSDFIRASKINSNNDEIFRIELGKILTNSDECNLLYVVRVDNPLLLPPKFVSSLAALIASKAAYGLAGGEAKANSMLSLYKMEMGAALIADRESGMGVLETTEAGDGVGTWRNREG